MNWKIKRHQLIASKSWEKFKMKHLVKAINRSKVVDGYGKITKVNLVLEVGECYIMRNDIILNKLKTQEELMGTMPLSVTFRSDDKDHR